MRLDIKKLYVKDKIGQDKTKLKPWPRKYTLTHSDLTGDLFLTIARAFELNQISDFYTRVMRDEVLAEWIKGETYSLHVNCHVSGGICFGSASLRDKIFRRELPLALEAICNGDRRLFELFNYLVDSSVIMHFNSKKKGFHKTDNWEKIRDYLI